MWTHLSTPEAVPGPLSTDQLTPAPGLESVFGFGPFARLFSGTNYLSLFFGGCPRKNGLPLKRVPLFSGVTEQLSLGGKEKVG